MAIPSVEVQQRGRRGKRKIRKFWENPWQARLHRVDLQAKGPSPVFRRAAWDKTEGRCCAGPFVAAMQGRGLAVMVGVLASEHDLDARVLFPGVLVVVDGPPYRIMLIVACSMVSKVVIDLALAW
jgi:hypothetical protein